MAKRLEIAEALNRDCGTFRRSEEAKDKEILAAEEKLKRKKGAYAYLVKRLKGC